MGEVWAATGETHPREVAIKVLLARAAMKPDLVRRFEREAKIASAIKSPYVCQFIEVGEAEDGAPLLVFEQLTGESLADRLKREQYLPFSEVGPIIDDVLQGLAAAHAAGVIHRDLKPGNIFLEQLSADEPSHPSSPAGPPPDDMEGRYERAKILDFGISKITRREKEEPTLTAFDATLGSFAYMAPEQVRGARGADERADIYAVGAVTFRSLSGRLPFEGTTAAVLVAMKLDRSAPSLAEATGERWPAGIERFLERALERKRERRFASADEALAAWRSIQPANITRARRVARPRTEPPPELPGTLPPDAPDAFPEPRLRVPLAPRVVTAEPAQPASRLPPPPSSSRPPQSSYPPPEDHPTEVDNPPTMTVDGAVVGDPRDPREPVKRRKTGRS
jgi:serine/threonine protein kinase